MDSRKTFVVAQSSFLEIDGFLLAGAGKSVLWYVKHLIFRLGTHDVGQFLNYPGHHCDAESRTGVASILLLRFQGRSEEGFTWIVVVPPCPALSSIQLLL